LVVTPLGAGPRRPVTALGCAGMSIFVRARFDVRDGRQADFEEVVEELRQLVDDEPDTLTYRFFSSGPGSYVVLEEYTDSAAAIAHNERARDLLKRVGECADMAYLEFYGPIWPELQEFVRSLPNATWFPESGE
jgi:quinol monooxygenase YgiN